MISIEDATNIHDILIDRFGGSRGIRDSNLLESALIRPYQTFEKQELYPSPEEKAAAIIESIVTNHPFIDGNKRFGYVVMRIILMESGKDISASEDVKFNFVTAIAKGEMNFKSILFWITKHLIC